MYDKRNTLLLCLVLASKVLADDTEIYWFQLMVASKRDSFPIELSVNQTIDEINGDTSLYSGIQLDYFLNTNEVRQNKSCIQ